MSTLTVVPPPGAAAVAPPVPAVSSVAAAAASPSAASASPASPAPVAAAATAASASSGGPGSPSALASPKSKARSKAAGTAAPSAAAAEVAEQSIVFKGSSRAKKIFKLFDNDKDKFLSRAEFASGLAGFVGAPGLSLALSQEAIDALWIETDLNQDGRVSYAEFSHRFCGGPHPSTVGKGASADAKKPSLSLQTPRRKDPASMGKGALAVADLVALLEAVYDGSRARFDKATVDLSGVKAMTPPLLKKLLSQVLAEEKAQAKAQKRALEAFAAPFASGPGVEQKNVDKLWAWLCPSKSAATYDLSPFFEQAKMRPATGKAGGKGKSKKKKAAPAPAGSGPQAHVLTTVKAEHVRDFLSDLVLKHMAENIATPHSVKCHPALKHWGDDERRKRALNTEGYKTTIFLSERTKVKAVVKLARPEGATPAAVAVANDPKSPTAASARVGSASAAAAVKDDVNHSDILIFCAFRTEYTAMARCESLWHARVTMDEYEEVRKVEMKEKKTWVDGELDRSSEACFDDWTQFVGLEDEFGELELSIPPIA